MTRPPSLQIQNFLMKNRKSPNSGLIIYNNTLLSMPSRNEVFTSYCVAPPFNLNAHFAACGTVCAPPQYKSSSNLHPHLRWD